MLHDLRRHGRDPASMQLDAAIHDPDDYGTARGIGARLRAAGALGVIYRSVRHADGECVGLRREASRRETALLVVPMRAATSS